VKFGGDRAIYFLLGITTLLFLPIVLNGGFIWDDELLVVGNQLTGKEGSLAELLRANLWSTTQSADAGSSFYRPAFLLSIWLDRNIFGLSPTGHHIHSLIWHLAAVYLVWKIIVRLGGLGKPAIIGASLFALHPVQAEAVCFISARNDSMTTVGALAAILIATNLNQNWKSLTSAFCLSAFAMLSKELGVITPALYLIMNSALDKTPVWKKSVRENLPFIVILAGVATVLAVRISLGHNLFGGAQSITETLTQLPKIISTYLSLIVPHFGATPTATLSSISTPWVGAAIALIFLLVAAVLSGRKGWLGLLFAAMAFAPAAWGAVSANSLGFRYLYLPMVGVAVTVGLASAALNLRMLTFLFPAALFAATSTQLPQWSSTEALWRTGFNRAPSQNTACGLFKTLEITAWEKNGIEREELFSEAEQALRAAISNPPDQYCCLSTTRWFWERNQNIYELTEPYSAIQWGENALEAGCHQSPEIMAPLAISYALAGRWGEAESTASLIEQDPFGFKAIVLTAAGLVRDDRTNLEFLIDGSSPEDAEALEQQAQFIINQSLINVSLEQQ